MRRVGICFEVIDLNTAFDALPFFLIEVFRDEFYRVNSHYPLYCDLINFLKGNVYVY